MMIRKYMYVRHVGKISDSMVEKTGGSIMGVLLASGGRSVGTCWDKIKCQFARNKKHPPRIYIG
jgi:hypothetical protein